MEEIKWRCQGRSIARRQVGPTPWPAAPTPHRNCMQRNKVERRAHKEWAASRNEAKRITSALAKKTSRIYFTPTQSNLGRNGSINFLLDPAFRMEHNIGMEQLKQLAA